ncbi:MAG: SufE family protein [Tannerellaceae bacterium]|jgi:cysteine desulfuration protein SufE|nr:SufE family protein [Tannerellaceae bacterium]
MMTMKEVQEQIVEEFSAFDDWMDRYSLLIEMGNRLQAEEKPVTKTEENLIEGCQSRVWMEAEYIDGKIFFRGESDAVIVRGIVALLVRVLSGRTPQEILEGELTFIEAIGLREHLSPTRSNGLLAMLKQMRMYALAYQAQAREHSA